MKGGRKVRREKIGERGEKVGCIVPRDDCTGTLHKYYSPTHYPPVDVSQLKKRHS